MECDLWPFTLLAKSLWFSILLYPRTLIRWGKYQISILLKGPVSGFVGIISLPTLESGIIWKHYTGAFLTFLFRFGLIWKTHYVWRVLVLYFKNITGDFCQTWGQVKIPNRQYLGLEAKNDENKGTLFSWTLKVGESKVVLLFLFLASMQRYWRFVILTYLHVWPKSPVMKILVP